MIMVFSPERLLVTVDLPDPDIPVSIVNFIFLYKELILAFLHQISNHTDH